VSGWVVITGCAVAAIVALLPGRRALISGAVALLALAFLATQLAADPTVDAVSPLSVACVFLVVALLRRLWQERRQALRLLEVERDTHLAEQRAAAADERARIARDLHDGLTHHLSGLLLQVQSARALLDDRDLSSASERMDSSIELARRSLVEARDVIDVLNSGPKDLATLDTVTDAWQLATGRQVRLDVPADVIVLDGARWGALLSTVREALTNIARHSTNTHVEVVVTATGPGGVRLRVTDTGPNAVAPRPPAPGGGHGLIGLTERAALLGGSVQAGHTPQGWQLELTLPQPPPAQTPSERERMVSRQRVHEPPAGRRRD